MSEPSFIIRNEQKKDHSAIFEVTEAAFANDEHSQQTEPYIIEALRAANALTLSLVAEAEGAIVGHIAFSPVTISDGSKGWYGLGPVSVHPNVQRNGIGKALIREGLDRLKKLNANGCCLVGHPEYYQLFGFKHTKGLYYEGVPSQYFLVLPLEGPVPAGQVIYHEAFAVAAP